MGMNMIEKRPTAKGRLRAASMTHFDDSPIAPGIPAVERIHSKENTGLAIMEHCIDNYVTTEHGLRRDVEIVAVLDTIELMEIQIELVDATTAINLAHRAQDALDGNPSKMLREEA